jgi:hypothetical protein
MRILLFVAIAVLVSDCGLMQQWELQAQTEQLTAIIHDLTRFLDVC